LKSRDATWAATALKLTCPDFLYLISRLCVCVCVCVCVCLCLCVYVCVYLVDSSSIVPLPLFHPFLFLFLIPGELLLVDCAITINVRFVHERLFSSFINLFKNCIRFFFLIILPLQPMSASCMSACMCLYACMHACYACVCMYVCMHVCMYVCIYVCMDGCMYVCMYVCMHVCMHACM
jgi:hypothetical protein